MSIRVSGSSSCGIATSILTWNSIGSVPPEGADLVRVELDAEPGAVGQVQVAVGVAQRRGEPLLRHEQRAEQLAAPGHAGGGAREVERGGGADRGLDRGGTVGRDAGRGADG